MESMEWIKVLGPTILVVLGGVVTWFLKDKSDQLKYQREKYIEEKRTNYIKLITPFVKMLSGIKNKNDEKEALEIVKSSDYKMTAFELMFYGSDGVINAYGNLFQHFYNLQENTDPYKSLMLLAKVKLEIRKDLGGNNTKLKEIDMLRYLITDADRLKSELQNSIK